MYASLTSWIRAKPPIAAIRIDGDDTRVIRIVGRQYSTAERAALAIGGSTLEGVDATGQVVRTWDLDQPQARAALPAGPSAPKTLETWPEGELGQLARVITMACDAAAQRHESAYSMAFEKLESLYRQQSERLSRLEELHYQNLQARVQSAEETAAIAQEEAAEAQEVLATSHAVNADGLAASVMAAAAEKMLPSLIHGGKK